MIEMINITSSVVNSTVNPKSLKLSATIPTNGDKILSVSEYNQFTIIDCPDTFMNLRMNRNESKVSSPTSIVYPICARNLNSMVNYTTNTSF